MVIGVYEQAIRNGRGTVNKTTGKEEY